jgi:hypothetical protein
MSSGPFWPNGRRRFTFGEAALSRPVGLCEGYFDEGIIAVKYQALKADTDCVLVPSSLSLEGALTWLL